MKNEEIINRLYKRFGVESEDYILKESPLIGHFRDFLLAEIEAARREAIQSAKSILWNIHNSDYSLHMVEEDLQSIVDSLKPTEELPKGKKKKINQKKFIERAKWLKENTDYPLEPTSVTEEEEDDCDNLCKHCGGDVHIRNPKGFCDHLYYPENCQHCRK